MTLSEPSPPLNHSLDLGRDMEAFVDQEAMKSLQQFCKPVEFYNMIQHRQAIYLRRSLTYARKKQQINESGKVLFYYLYYFNTRWKIQATEEFSCPICLMACSSFRGLQSHLDASHDLFHFEYSAAEGTCAVIVTCKNPSGVELKCHDRDADPLRCFFYRRRKHKTRRAKLRIPGTFLGDEDRKPLSRGVPQAFRTSARVEEATTSKPGATSFPTKQRARKSILECQTSASPDLMKGSLIRASATRYASAIQKLQRCHPIERNRAFAEPSNGALLEKRQFYHSHTCQPMAREHVFSGHDSEDEVDDTVVSWESRQLLDDFIDVSNHEKEVFHRWNDFVRRQRVIADCHCPGACVAFARQNAADFNKSPSLRRCFMFMLIRFFEYRLIQGDTVDECLGIVDEWPQPYTRLKLSPSTVSPSTITNSTNVFNNHINTLTANAVGNFNNTNASIGSQALVMIQ